MYSEASAMFIASRKITLLKAMQMNAYEHDIFLFISLNTCVLVSKLNYKNEEEMSHAPFDFNPML